MHHMPDGKPCKSVVSEVRDQYTTMVTQRRDARFSHFEREGGRVWAYRFDGEWERVYCGWSPEAAANVKELG